MESSMSACSAVMSMARCSSLDSRGINTNNININAAVSLPRVSLYSNRYLVFSDQSSVQYSYSGVLQPYCGKKNKLERWKLKDLCTLSDGSLSDKKRVKLLQSLLKYLFLQRANCLGKFFLLLFSFS